ncbi:MAG: MoaD/ThiS family protein [Candidatus Freyarchaeota archaeon]
MKIYVQFFGKFREQFKTSYLWVTLPSGATIVDLIEELEKSTGVDIKKLIMNPEKEFMRNDVSVLINGRSIAFLNGLRSKLNDMDKVIVSHLVAGG